MAVIDTKEWLSQSGENPIQLCEHLVKYFKGNSPREIYDYLCLYGMYKPSIFNRNKEVNQLIELDYWSEVDKLYRSLRKKQKGPDIPVFIFPINQRETRMMEENKGKSGLAFYDKLFMFLSPNLEIIEIKALLTHEYHHVCRLKYLNKEEESMTLLDAMVLEGLAELSVKEECGEDQNASWTRFYSDDQLLKWYNEFIEPNKHITKRHPKYHELLFGLKGYPRMLGYAVGLYMVKQALPKCKHSLQSLEKLMSEEYCKYIPSES
ncbi:DUF2268 domain-containing protein [Bacillus pinisoli]|uniref:DUF2268 domain-containing protein n=1 Tax=Bacillus pinisoli TaxID=2901866 RepID=UPI001FF64870|nr:DUF2268 domain-containing protein [Bacillus pinisoli]